MSHGNNKCSDADLLEAFIAGDEGAARELHENYHRLVASVILNILPSKKCNHQQDVTSDVWFTLLGRKKIAGVKHPEELPDYLIATARNKSFNHLRDVHKERPPLPEAEPVNIQTLLESAERVALLLRPFKQEHRLIVLLRIENFSYREIAELSGLSESNVKAIYLRVVHKLKRALG